MPGFSRFCLLLMLGLTGATLVFGQDQTAPSTTADPGFARDYPVDRPGIFLQGQTWQNIQSQMPLKTKATHSIAASFSYGLVPAKVVAEYGGTHAATQTDTVRPTLCICHFISLPGQPVLVRLHVKKNARELDGGRMTVYPVVGGSKLADANKSDLIPADVQQIEPQIWLVRPQVALEPGEYALMLGTQNIAVFPFAVAGSAGTK